MGSDKGAHGCAVRERAGAAFARVATRRLRPAFKVGGSERRQNRASHSGIRTRGQFLVAAAKPRIGRAVHSHTPLSSRVSRIPFRLSPSPRPNVSTIDRVLFLSLFPSSPLRLVIRVFVRAVVEEDIDESNTPR